MAEERRPGCRAIAEVATKPAMRFVVLKTKEASSLSSGPGRSGRTNRRRAAKALFAFRQINDGVPFTARQDRAVTDFEPYGFTDRLRKPLAFDLRLSGVPVSLPACRSGIGSLSSVRPASRRNRRARLTPVSQAHQSWLSLRRPLNAAS